MFTETLSKSSKLRKLQTCAALKEIKEIIKIKFANLRMNINNFFIKSGDLKSLENIFKTPANLKRSNYSCETLKILWSIKEKSKDYYKMITFFSKRAEKINWKLNLPFLKLFVFIRNLGFSSVFRDFWEVFEAWANMQHDGSLTRLERPFTNELKDLLWLS